ncbi:hypothetical protein N9N67_09005 [Bacteriovoracaceae bacterium]|nr:hypothetical protein [Bacteriovoracaceae bacterium]
MTALSVGPLDYSRELNSNREGYNRASEQKDKAHKAEMEAREHAHNKQVKNLRDNHKGKIDTMEDSYQKTLDNLNDSQSKAVESKTKNYRTNIEDTKRKFWEERRQYNKQFKDRLDNLTDSYRKKSKEETSVNDKRQNELRTNYDKRLNKITKSTQDELNKYADNSISQNNAQKESFADEKKTLIKKYDEGQIDLQREEQEKRNIMRDQIVKDLERMKSDQTKERITQRDIARERFSNVQNNANTKVKQTKDMADQEMKRVLQQNKVDNRKQNRDFSNKLSDQEKNFSRELRKRDIKSQAQHGGAGGLKAKIAKEEVKQAKLYANERVSAARKEQMDQKYKYDKIIDDQNKKFQDEYRKVSVDSAMEKEVIEKNAIDKNYRDRSRERLIRDNMVRNYDLKIENDEKDFREVIKSDRELNKTKLENLKKNFNYSLQEAERASRENFNMMRTETIKERREKLEEINKKNTADKSEMRGKFSRKVDLVTGAYDNKIKALEIRNDDLRTTMDNTISDLSFKSKFEIDRQKKAARDERRKSKEDFSKLIKANESRYSKNLTDLQKSYEAKILKERRVQAQGIRKVQNSMKQDLQDVKDKFAADLERQTKSHERQLDQVKSNSFFEKQTLITKYENQIEQYKAREKNLTEQIKEFKKVDEG